MLLGYLFLVIPCVLLNHHEIDDDLFRALRVQFTDAQIVELGMMIGQYIGFGRLVSVLGLERSACTL